MMLITPNQQLHLDKLHEKSIEHMETNWDYGNCLSALMMVYQELYIQKNSYQEVWEHYTEVVEKHQKLKEKYE